MHLKLVVDNRLDSKSDLKYGKTCRSHCTFFDLRSNKCGIFKNIKADDPRTVYRCQKFSEWNLDQKMEQKEVYELIEDDFTVEFEDENFVFELMGETFNSDNSTYPLEPDVASGRDDAIWYCAADKSFGCWIINKSAKRFLQVKEKQEVEPGWMKKIYRSPYPLHDHASSDPLKSRMAWFVDENGWGQYVLLINGKVEMLSSPKPSNWNK